MTPKAWLYRFALFLRAEYPTQVDRLLKSRPPFLDSKTDWGIDFLLYWSGYQGDLALTQRLCELFPELASPDGWFIKWANSVSPAEADRWLAERGSGRDNIWFYERLAFRARLGTEQELLAPLEKALRENPEDYERLRNYAAAVAAAGKRQAATWLASVIKPRLAVQGYILAGISDLPANVRIAVYEQTLALPYTRQDAAFDARHDRKYRSHDGNAFEPWTEKQIRTWTTDSLLKLYEDSGEAQKARNLRGDAAIKTPPRVRAAPVKSVVEDKGSAAYWLARGQDYSGRQEDTLAKEAFETVLRLLPVPPNSGPHSYIYGEVIQAYALHLAAGSPKAAYDWLHQQLEKVPVQDPLFPVLTQQLLGYAPHPFRKGKQAGVTEAGSLADDDPLLWRYLAARSDWTRDAELLEHLIRAAPKEKRQSQWLRAEALLQGDALAQRFVLAQTVSRVEGERAAVPLYRRILERTNNKPEQSGQRERALSLLFYAYCSPIGFRGTPDLHALVEIDAELRKQRKLRGVTSTSWGTLAMVAARAGEKAEAVRYFFAWVNEDRRAIGEGACQRAAEMSITDEFRRFCRELEKTEPQCAMPARIRKILGDPSQPAPQHGILPLPSVPPFGLRPGTSTPPQSRISPPETPGVRM
jgi:hypothetical protein